jgi:hypothetical protein
MNGSDQDTKVKEPTWFLLYEDTSCDGKGPAKYVGRTTDKTVAFNHCKKQQNHSNLYVHYGTRHVMAITDTKEIIMDATCPSVCGCTWEEL